MTGSSSTTRTWVMGLRSERAGTTRIGTPAAVLKPRSPDRWCATGFRVRLKTVPRATDTISVAPHPRVPTDVHARPLRVLLRRPLRVGLAALTAVALTTLAL